MKYQDSRINKSLLVIPHKKKTFFFTALVLLVITVISPIAFAQTYSLSIKPSTLGIVIEGIRSLSPRFDARVGFAYYTYTYSEKDNSDYTLNADIKTSAVSAIIDWFPRESIFHLSAGFMYNLNGADAVLKSKNSHEVGGRTYTPAKLGNLFARVEFNKVVPYLGMGFGNGNDSHSGFTFDIGAFYQGPPRVKLRADGLLIPSTEQAPIVEDNISWFKLYPVVSFGYIYNF